MIYIHIPLNQHPCHTPFADVYIVDTFGTVGDISVNGQPTALIEKTFSCPLSREVDRDGIETLKSKRFDYQAHRVTVQVGDTVRFRRTWTPANDYRLSETCRQNPLYASFIVPSTGGWTKAIDE